MPIISNFPGGEGWKSAYEAAVEAGYTGTEAEFYAALVTLQNAPFLPLSGGELSGPLFLGEYGLIIGDGSTPGAPEDFRLRMQYFDNADGSNASLDLLQLGPSLNPTGRKIKILGVDTPIVDYQAANKKYVDDRIDDTVTLLDAIGVTSSLVRIFFYTNAGCVKSVYVKLAAYQLGASYVHKLSYSRTFMEEGITKVVLAPPTGYAFTGISGTYCPDLVVGENAYKGVLNVNGKYTFTFPATEAGTAFSFAANKAEDTDPKFEFALLTLEVA